MAKKAWRHESRKYGGNAMAGEMTGFGVYSASAYQPARRKLNEESEKRNINNQHNGVAASTGEKLAKINGYVWRQWRRRKRKRKLSVAMA
jgi:hypothetical protein